MQRKENSGIFIVEDNLIYQQLIARELESFGEEIHFFTTGEYCIASLHRRPAIVVLDYNLDGKMNGLDTLEEIRKFDANIFVVLFSSQKEVYSDENQRRYGSFDFLEKKNHSFSLLRQLLQARMNITAAF
jgi:CheY-like chemotaxis protein